MIALAVAPPRLVAKHHGSFVSSTCTHTTAPTGCSEAVRAAPDSLTARPPLPTQSAAGRRSPVAAATCVLPRNRITSSKPPPTRNPSEAHKPSKMLARRVVKMRGFLRSRCLETSPSVLPICSSGKLASRGQIKPAWAMRSDWRDATSVLPSGQYPTASIVTNGQGELHARQDARRGTVRQLDDTACGNDIRAVG